MEESINIIFGSKLVFITFVDYFNHSSANPCWRPLNHEVLYIQFPCKQASPRVDIKSIK